MKKIISALLAAILLLGILPAFVVPANAAGFSVSISYPAGKDEDDLWLKYDEEKFPDISNLAAGTVFKFNIGLHEKYDPRYCYPYIGSAALQYNSAEGGYVITVTGDVNITFPGGDDNLRVKTFRVDNPTSDGYVVRPIKLTAGAGPTANYMVPWGGSYRFRVQLLAGYEGAYNVENPAASRMKVTVKTLEGEIIEMDGERLRIIDDGTCTCGMASCNNGVVTKKVYSATGKYTEEGYGRYYDLVAQEIHFELNDIKTDMYPKINGVVTDSMQNVLDMFVRIFRLLLNLLFGGGTVLRPLLP